MNDDVFSSSLSYWKKTLGDSLPVLELSTDRARLAVQSYSAKTYGFVLPASALAELHDWCRGSEATLFEGLLAVYQILLQRYTGQDDVVIAASSAIPGGSEAVQTFLLRVNIGGNPTFRELLARTTKRRLEAQEQAALTLGQLRRELYPRREASSIYQTAFALQNSAATSAPEGNTEKLEVAFALAATPQGWEGAITYNADLFDAATIARMAGHYETLLHSAMEHPDTNIELLPILPAAEYKQIVDEWNATQIEFPYDACLHELFEKQAENFPDKIAVVFKDEQLTYGELNRRANQLAHYLQRLGMGPDVLAGVYMERSLEMIIGLYAILKAGGAYVPLDPSYPASRLAFMLEDTQVAVLLTQQHLAANLPEHHAKVVTLDHIDAIIASESATKPESAVTAEHLAYVIYTSGSTGRPKGAVLNHRGRVSNFCDFNRRYNLGVNDRLIGLASLSFDMSAYDIFGTLLTGGTIVIVEGEAILEPNRWAEMMVQHDITVWHSVPALLEMLVNHYDFHVDQRAKMLRLVLLGGDWIPVNLPDRLKAMAPNVHIVSMGGATEVSMDSTIYDIVEPSSKWKSIPYGVPMMNQLSYVLDEYLQPMPIGAPNELHLGGVGVGRGYFNRPELTAQKFIPNPFSGIPGDRMYKTGDLARYRPDSNLELLGRMDFQVKIRGFRIELGEITSALTRHPGVKEAVVIAKEKAPGRVGGEKQLVAYVVPNLQYQEPDQAASDEYRDEQLAQWQKIFDESYVQDHGNDDPTFNISTWNSSYTGLPLAAEEMREWVEQSVVRIFALQPQRVLEIACGTGLLLFRVAPQTQKYVGGDFSKSALRYIETQLSKPEYRLPQVELLQRLADNFDGIEPNSFDLGILHSVVQLFPSVDYLRRVLDGLIRAVKPGGYIYLGDMISLPHMAAFHTSVQLYQAPAALSTAQLRQRIQKAGIQEEQLFLDPAFFFALQQLNLKISHVQIQLRRGRYLNEMTRFRYDVVLHLDSPVKTTGNHRWLDWQEQQLTLPALIAQLQTERPETLGVARVPNARLAEVVKAMELLASSDAPATAGELQETVNDLPRENFVDPEALWAIGNDLPYAVDITWSGSGDISCCDVLFRRRTNSAAMPLPAFLGNQARPKPWPQYANNPLQGKVVNNLKPQLRGYLQQRLPGYMVPSVFVMLEALPLSPNGKIDRRALPAPDAVRPETRESYVAPRHALEEVVADIWAGVFGYGQIGVQDNFLEIGGHSLLAMQIMSRLREVFPIEISLRDLFESLTVAGLAERILQAGQKAHVEVVEIAQTLMQMNQLSDEEVEAMLTKDEKILPEA